MAAFTISIKDLLARRKIESERIEFKKGWNPAKIYRTICAFANDFDNLGGGYILVGIDEADGVAVRPVEGIPVERIDGILKEMVGYNNMIEPYYMPRTSVEEVDGKTVLAIWVPSGANRPYSVMSDVTSKRSRPLTYIRSGTSTIEAKGEILSCLRDMANRTPFDDRGNPAIHREDISAVRLRDYLIAVGSRLAEWQNGGNIIETLESMNLLEGPQECRLIKNVAAMMFCDHPQKFFPVTRVEIVIFPEGCIQNPDNLIEAPVIEGPVPAMIDLTMSYLKTNVIKEKIIKPRDDLKSIRFFNYPYQALEEAVTNALYHRDYQEREPVEITIEPDKITILSFAGPDRSISIEAITKGERLYSRRYRNRRLGDFLKELEYTEGRSTGIPTIQKELQKNGSPRATFETNEERSYFMTTIPIHPNFYAHLYPDQAGGHQNPGGHNVSQDVPQGVSRKTELLQALILTMIRENNKVTRRQIAIRANLSTKSISRAISNMPILKFVGRGVNGHWEITE